MPFTRPPYPTRKRILRTFGWLVPTAALLLSTGCARTREVHQFEPQPRAHVGQRDLQPTDRRSTTELLRAAEEAFQQGNKAQETGDQETALKYYTAMLELLIEADLDPAVYYGLREDFKRILETGTEHARLFEEGVSSGGGFGLLAGDLPIPFPIPELVLGEIDKIQNEYPKGFAEGLNRSYLYAPHLREEFAKAGLPRDLVWLAMVESWFKPYAKSRAGAAGMWQFMADTGRRHGLRMDSYVDERYNWERATQAAIAYLKNLNSIFGGDWPLAITAYNMGEGGVERAIAETGGERDIWKLVANSSRMQPETREFYAKLLATVIVARSPERYGFRPQAPTPQQTIRVPVCGSYSLSRLADAAGVSTSELKDLNPDLIAGVTPPSGTHMLAVPASGRDRLLAALQSLPEDSRKPVYAAASSGSHMVRRGETLSHIAARYGVPVRELRRVNNMKSDRIHAGQRLSVPGLATSTASASASPTASPTTGLTSKPAKTSTHRVKHGDTLYDIAKAYRVSLADLRAWNNLGARSQIHPGQTLQIGSAGPTGAAPSGAMLTHVVQSGEAPSTIAQRYGVSTSDLLTWNDLSGKSTIRPGQKLLVYPAQVPESSANTEPPKPPASTEPPESSADTAPPGPSPSTETASEKRVHKVANGDSPWTIASKYGIPLDDFLAWNGLERTSVLQPGQECIVSGGVQTAKATTATAASTGTDAAALEKKMHTAKSGECAGIIAEHYGIRTSDFLKWNNLTAKSKLKAGKSYIVYVPAT